MGTQVKVAWVSLLHSERPNEVEFIPENPLGNKIELFRSAKVEKSSGLLSAPRSSSYKRQKTTTKFLPITSFPA